MSALGAQARSGPKPLTAAQAEARNETAAPGFSGRVREAWRITSFLADAPVLSNVQWHAVQAHAVAQHQALALAITAADAAQAQRQYLKVVQNVLATSQLADYGALRRQLAGTMLPLGGFELAAR
ncbi:hypothetical protein [Hymenobacter terricola]|uniref:hypothetical protein n=1 Tax=Hymenobacter terricola TaxID=2819236 RepID=UPI001B30D767|nr:hypothetical protein [Hymenobacter terricola]